MNGLVMVTTISVYLDTTSHTPFLAVQVALSAAEMRGNITARIQFNSGQRR
jgi:hypothetical protein